jgi:3-methyladenine DNA glycosylase/8-oxoguanine DNA glycosylase
VVAVNPISATWAVDARLDLVGNSYATRFGGGDPTGFVRDGRVWRASWHSSGAAALSVWLRGSTLHAEAWGDGAADALAGVPELVGLTDDASGFDPSRHAVVADAARRRPGLRLARTRSIFDAGVRAIIAQKVTGLQAKRSYQLLARRAGVPAPMPRVTRRPLLLPVTPDAVLAALAGHGATTLGIDISRANALRDFALVAHHFAALESLPPQDAHVARDALQKIPGVGEWTANEITAVALGDPDAVSVGDYHLKDIVVFALTGRPRGTDEEMVHLLEPFRPHRARAVRLIAASGLRPPKYGPRMSVPDHVPFARR